MSYFDEAYYLQAKLKQLGGTTDPEGQAWTMTSLKKAIADAGLTPEEHYNAYGRAENLNPNPYFNEKEYLAAKLAQVNSTGEKDPDGNPYTLATLAKAIESAGLTPAEHYEKYGAFEADDKGQVINPSNAFDANAYYQAKLVQMQAKGESLNGKPAAEVTVAEVIAALKDAGLSPVAHYETYGVAEAGTDKVALVQTVPVSQRVPNDPVREVLGENVPGNYNPATTGAASSTATAKPVAKPADIANKVPTDVSPTVTPPSKPLPTPTDDNYVKPPAGLVDTNEKPVIPPTTSGTGNATDGFVVVNPDGSGEVINPDGTPGGTLPPGTITPGGGSPVVPPEVKPVPPTPTPDPTPDPEPEPEPKPEPKPDPVDITFTATVKNTSEVSVKTDVVLDRTYTIAVDGDTKTTVTGRATANLHTGAVTSLDLSEVKTTADVNDYKLFTDLTKAPDTLVKFTGTALKTANDDPNAAVTQSGNDYVKMTNAKAAGWTADAGKTFNAGTGDDIVDITDGISGSFTAGALKGVETIVAEYKAASGGTAVTINLAAAAADTGENLTLLLKGTPATAGGRFAGADVTLTGAGANNSGFELSLMDLEIDNVKMQAKLTRTDPDQDAGVSEAALELHNSTVATLDLTNTAASYPLTLTLNLSGDNDVKFKEISATTKMVIGNFESFNAGTVDLTHTAGTSKVDLSAQTKEMTVVVEREFDGKLELTGGSGDDNFFGDGQDDTNYHTGAAVTRGEGSTLIGGLGADIIRGTAKDDIIYGSTKANASEASDGSNHHERYDTAGMIQAKNVEFLAQMNADSSAKAKFVNVYNGWLGNDEMIATDAKDSFEYHTHVLQNADSKGVGYAASTFKALGEDTIVGFEIGKDMLLVNMIELSQTGGGDDVTAGTNGVKGHGITAVPVDQTGTFADILIKGNLVAGEPDSGKVSYKVTQLTGTGYAGDNDFKVVFTFGDGEGADTLTINLVDLVGTGVNASWNAVGDLFLA